MSELGQTFDFILRPWPMIHTFVKVENKNFVRKDYFWGVGGGCCFKAVMSCRHPESNIYIFYNKSQVFSLTTKQLKQHPDLQAPSTPMSTFEECKSDRFKEESMLLFCRIVLQ